MMSGMGLPVLRGLERRAESFLPGHGPGLMVELLQVVEAAGLLGHEVRQEAAEIEHAIKHEIHVHRDKNPAAYTSLWEQVEKIVNERREARISAASALARLQEVADRVVGVRAGSSPSGKGLSGTAGAILPFIDDAFTPEVRTEAATDVAKALEGYTVVVDWQHKEDVQRQMRRGIKERLRTLGMEPAKIEAVTAKVMDVARARLAR